MSDYRRRLLYIWKNNIHTEIEGSPSIETDETGDVISFENTEEVTVTEANTEIETLFVPFDGKNWELHIYAHFKASEQTEEYPTLLCCMDHTSPWPGITIRYEDTLLYCIFNDGSGNKHYYKLSTDSSGNVNITITYSNNVATGVNNNTTFMNKVSMKNMNLEDLELSLMADTGDNKRYGIGTIYEFYIKKID